MFFDVIFVKNITLTFADGTWNFEPESGEVSAVSPA